MNIYKALAIHAWVIALVAAGETEKLSALLAWLNASGIQTNAGQPYRRERGVARMLSAAYA